MAIIFYDYFAINYAVAVRIKKIKQKTITECILIAATNKIMNKA